MTWKKFEYFLNAVYYCIWLNQSSFQAIIQKMIYMMLSPIPKYFFPDKWRDKFYERQAIGQNRWNEYRNNPKHGWNIGMAARNFSILCAMYPLSIALILMGISLKYSIDVDSWSIVFVVGGLVALFEITLHKLVYSNDKYLKYFKKFQKEDSSWLKKWERITIAFCGCCIIAPPGGLALTWIILIYW